MTSGPRVDDEALIAEEPVWTPRSSAVQAQLARVLRSRKFVQATALSRLLRHVVQRTLEGRRDELKEYALGVDVFNRGADFDPRTDTIVRVQARRLRAKLQEYYETEGRADPLVIALPRGAYVPEFLAPERRMPLPAPTAGALRLLHEPLQLDPIDSRGAGAFSLPAPRTSLIGRARELKAIEALLRRPEVRLITLTGAGGSGKTRLAQEAAARAVTDCPGGVAFISLASLNSADAVASTLAQVLGLRQTDGRSLAEALPAHVQQSIREPMLLALDNFEHLLDAAPLLVSLLDACAPLNILVTSRFRLRLYGEHDYPVPPLTLPESSQLSDLAALGENPAVALFVERATAADPAFELTTANAADVARICCRVDGLPLAIELAAAGIKLLTPEAILARLHNPLDTLSSSSRDVPARQQTLRKTLDWSFSLLDAAEQQLFRRFSVFAGGCTLEGAGAVCNARRDLQLDVAAGMASLLDKSLVQRAGGTQAEPRFAMIETVREYALELLTQSEDGPLTRRAHAAYCLVLAEEGTVPLTESQRDEWFTRCDAEHANFRAALDFVIRTGDAEWAHRLGAALYVFWERRDHLAEGRAWLEAVLATGSDEARRTGRWAKASCFAGGLCSLQGDFDASDDFNRAALEVYRRVGDQRGVITILTALGLNERMRGSYASSRAWFEQCLDTCRQIRDELATAAALTNLASAVSKLGEHDLARGLLEEALEGFRATGSHNNVAWVLNSLGDIARDRKEHAEALRLYREALEVFRRVGDRWGKARACADLGELACGTQDFAAARAWLEESLALFTALRHRRGILNVLESFAGLAAAEGHTERALTLAGAVDALRAALKFPARPHAEATFRQSIESAWRAHDPAAAECLRAGGARLNLEQAAALALGADLPPAESATRN